MVDVGEQEVDAVVAYSPVPLRRTVSASQRRVSQIFLHCRNTQGHQSTGDLAIVGQDSISASQSAMRLHWLHTRVTLPAVDVALCRSVAAPSCPLFGGWLVQ